ncbi:hypothetical protein [Haloarcula laminariae]|uniref:hypothetical protein n=1 Tax=Haloarcula laminariae TaxID=2961577 RepID=UPI00240646F3|nr:hypothetical protein [Halomicroarcula sp. FL173]
MLPRRRLLALTGSLIVGAGCSGTSSESGPQVVCDSGVLAGGGDVVFGLTPQVSSYGRSDNPVVELTVPVRQSVLTEESVDRIEIRRGGETEYTVPVSPENDEPVGDSGRYDADDVVEYTQSLGHVPQNGRPRLVALDAEDEQLDELRIEFRCYRRPERQTS